MKDALEDIERHGVTLVNKVFLRQKNVPQPGGGVRDVELMAQAGTPVVWGGKTNEGHEESYGGKLLYWLDLAAIPGLGFGAVLDEEFVFIDQD